MFKEFLENVEIQPSSTWGLVGNMLGFLLLLVVINVPAGWLGIEFSSEPVGQVWLQPPGWLVVAAWLVLFPALGAARWLVMSSSLPSKAAVSWMIVGLGVLCAAYAYYTLGLERLTGVSSAVYGLIGNLLVIAVALAVAWAVARHSTLAAWLVAAVSVWTAFATVSVVQFVTRIPSP